MRVRERLAELELEIPPAQVVPEGVRLTYRRLVKHGEIVYVARHRPRGETVGGRKLGKLGRELTIEQGVGAVRLAALNVLARSSASSATWTRSPAWLKINGYVDSFRSEPW